MTTTAQTISPTSASWSWLSEFLKHELSPYRGRAALVARMVIAATLVMLIGMVFRIPYTFQGAIYALTISRESSEATLKSAAAILAVTGVCGAYLIASASLVISSPTLHFLWVIASFFLGFYAISTIKNFGASSTFAIMICVGVPIWDRQVSAETNLDDTLWLCLASAIGVVVTLAVEKLFSRIKPGEDMVMGIAERLAAVQRLLACFAENRPVDRETQEAVIGFATAGTSLLRRHLRRSAATLDRDEQMGALIALTGTLIDLAANLGSPDHLPTPDRQEIGLLADRVGGIRSVLLNEGSPRSSAFDGPQPNGRHAIPFVAEMEKTVQSLNDILAGSLSLVAFAASPPNEERSSFFVRDAFTGVEHVHVALKGCLTASLCYILYSGLDWPGISTAVTTCFLTALSTVGSSRQKQVLRITGAVVGGFVIGMGCQIFVLPYLDSIAGFTVLFILVSVFAAWFMTSSPRLSYFGVQIAVAFYLIHLNSFAIESSLSIARDRVVGILLGLVMMWLVFDQLWGAPSVAEMQKAFTSALRLIARFAREPVSGDRGVALEQSYALREQISRTFDVVRASADAVLFEFGPSRQQNLAWRSRFRQWQPNLRVLFVAEIALWKYRAGLPSFTLPPALNRAQRTFDEELARTLEAFAKRVGGQPSPISSLEDSLALLERTVHVCQEAESQSAERFEVFFSLYRRIQSVTSLLQEQIEKVA